MIFLNQKKWGQTHSTMGGIIQEVVCHLGRMCRVSGKNQQISSGRVPLALQGRELASRKNPLCSYTKQEGLNEC